MPDFWPFPPDEEMTDTYAFATNVMRAPQSEKRFPISNSPRRSLAMKHFLTDDAYAVFRAIAEKNSSYSELDVPLWPSAAYLGDVSLGQTVFTFDTTKFDFIDRCVVYTSYEEYEICDISVLDPASITIAVPLVAAHSACYIIPLVTAIPTSGFQISRSGATIQMAAIIFKIIDDAEFGAGLTATLFKTLPLIPYRPSRNQDVTETIIDDITEIDSMSGKFYIHRNLEFTNKTMTVELRSSQRDMIFNIREFLGYLRGKSEPFWLPNYFNEITLLATAISVASNALVKKIMPPADYVGKYTYLELNDGTIILSEIIAAADESGAIRITFDDPLGVNVPVANVRQFCFMKHVRSDSDEFSLNYTQGFIGTVFFPTVEVPEI